MKNTSPPRIESAVNFTVIVILVYSPLTLLAPGAYAIITSLISPIYVIVAENPCPLSMI
jgi:hypothetical protein